MYCSVVADDVVNADILPLLLILMLLWRLMFAVSVGNNVVVVVIDIVVVIGSQVCIVATGVVGDLCRALEKDILPYCQHIMVWLMFNLEGANINR